MKKLTLTALIALLIMSSFVITGCGDDDDNNDNNSIYPLAVGNTWVSRDSTYTFIEGLGGSFEIEIDTLIINSTGVFDGNTYYGDSTDGWSRNTNDGVYNWNDSLGIEELIVLYPVSVGDKFYSSMINDTVEVLSTSFNVTVPAGSFECVRYQGMNESLGNMVMDFYLSAGVGMVKMEMSTSSAGYDMTMISKLQSYNIH